jgi:O-antigen ligase
MFFTSIVLIYIFAAHKKTFFISVAAVMSAGLVLYLFNGIVHDRVNLAASEFTVFLSGNANTNVGARLLLWKAAFVMFLSNPVLGIGTGDYVHTMNVLIASGQYPLFLAEFNQPHSMYFFALATNGLLGLFSLIFIFCRGIALSLGRMKTGADKLFVFVATATLIHYMAGGLTDSFLNIQILRYTFAFVLGICVRRGLKRAEHTE